MIALNHHCSPNIFKTLLPIKMSIFYMLEFIFRTLTSFCKKKKQNVFLSYTYAGYKKNTTFKKKLFPTLLFVSGDKTTPEKPTPTEPSISQAQPGAIALAGPGGVAAAAPRGTALVGQGGLAVASPQATAVAGPSKDDAGEKRKKNSNKFGRQ